MISSLGKVSKMAQKKKDLDMTDLRILEELQKNARASFTEIGASVCLSAPAVRDRIKQMEEDGLISGYKAILNHSLLGKPIKAMITVQVKREHGRWRVPDSNVVRLFSLLPEVIRFWSVTGDLDYIVEVAMPSMKNLEDLHRKLETLGIFTTYMILECSGEPSMRSPGAS
jgi:Lrp/AsnC family leucine-responsive transcriptional regulator